MYRASEARSLDVLSLPNNHFPSVTDSFLHCSQPYGSRSQIPHSSSQGNKVDVYNLRQLTLQRERESGHKLDAPYLTEHTNPTQRWLEGLDTPPSVEMNASASLDIHSARQHEFVLPNIRSDSHTPYNPEYTNNAQASRLTSDRLDNSRAQMPLRSVQSTMRGSERHHIAEFLQIPLASGVTREGVPGFATNARNDLPVDFAAQMTCLFWFESTSTLQSAENYTSGAPFPINPANMAKEATPSESFSKWARNMLSITQVSKSVTLLALLFIYRLKTLCPTVKGQLGSEYRLLTVALMLGNKFLDDNTYTNKTWAEVSHIPVDEIHMMEVEFLSNMRYSLLATEVQWQSWQIKLSSFSSFMDTYSQVKAQSPGRFCLPPPSNVHLPSANSLQASPPRSRAIQHGLQTTNSCQWSTMPTFAPVLVPNLTPTPSLFANSSASRKRSYDIDVGEPPAKRLQSDHGGTSRFITQLPPPTRLNLGMPTPASSVQSGFLQSLPSLPPNLATPAYTPHPVGSVTPTVQLTNNIFPRLQYGTPTRRTSPQAYDAIAYDTTRSYNSSPISGIFQQSYTMHSPSMYLQHRSSPYRPVRPPHTLLHPPPSEALKGHAAKYNQMHYQPLGRRNDCRSGVLPDYRHEQYMAQQQPWQLLPQPNFTRH